VGRIQAMLVWAMLGLFAVSGRDFVVLWAGEQFVDVYTGALILMLSLAVSSVQSLGTVIMQAKNRLGFRAAVFAIMLCTFCVGVVPAAEHFGMVGVCSLGAGILILGTGPVMNAYYYYGLGLDVPGFVRAVAPTVVPVFAACGVVLAMRSASADDPSWWRLSYECAIFLCVFATTSWFALLTPQERDGGRQSARRFMDRLAA
jgi:hypothetical protein